MDYITLFREKHIQNNELYPRHDIGVARLFFDLHSQYICYVKESKSWYTYRGRRWVKDEGGLRVMEICKDFAQDYAKYAEYFEDGSEENKAYIKFAKGLTNRRRRESILSDARSIRPISLEKFDMNKTLLNCINGTFCLATMKLLPHNPKDYITKLANVNYDPAAKCERWETFINEVMCGDMETARFLQKALGYALSGETALECFFIFYGDKTRNGKSTLSETVAFVMGEYARTIQPQTLSRRPADGGAASPDTARLKGARLVNVPEPEKGLELNIALVKQLTGGDTYTARFLNENPVEFKPEFKIFINTNHLPRTSDDTVFLSGRVKLIPFDRHFQPHEQDNGLKAHFRKQKNRSGILNWLIEGYRLLQLEGLPLPEKVNNAIQAYRQETDIIGSFLSECTAVQDENRIPASDLYAAYTLWAKDNGYRQMNNKNFVAELRRRLDVRRGGVGNIVVGVILDYSENPFD
ncbi:MAG: phage/plasmid primase, P4 family [Defluviitaleaceae bacterium]|nr:phage/plasmid primase, P4 family [Defluviitaleaceae bacterium]